ncbi:hypothetical protein [uncultured Winogradskyella sp.]|uniref:hypothetical protein n=1 Tax=uncultured Winogradskyella sp. TaxID=395353 RepID=UPI002625719B|nr:hypothetical protein [uncultured Winogradskyella sp.]
MNLVVNGRCFVGENNSIGVKNNFQKINYLISGSVRIGHNNKVESSMLLRFHSNLIIGNYNVINKGSQIRCDEEIIIGNFNQISYDTMIWDTNTHNIYSAKKRRELTISYHSGYEYEKPNTKQVLIGDDNWIGKSVVILKDTQIGDKCIIAYGTLLSKIKVKNSMTIMQNIELKTFENNV